MAEEKIKDANGIRCNKTKGMGKLLLTNKRLLFLVPSKKIKYLSKKGFAAQYTKDMAGRKLTYFSTFQDYSKDLDFSAIQNEGSFEIPLGYIRSVEPKKSLLKGDELVVKA